MAIATSSSSSSSVPRVRLFPIMMAMTLALLSCCADTAHSKELQTIETHHLSLPRMANVSRCTCFTSALDSSGGGPGGSWSWTGNGTGNGAGSGGTGGGSGSGGAGGAGTVPGVCRGWWTSWGWGTGWGWRWGTGNNGGGGGGGGGGSGGLDGFGSSGGGSGSGRGTGDGGAGGGGSGGASGPGGSGGSGSGTGGVLSGWYLLGEYARCMGRGRCKGMKLICPLHCHGPCFYDCTRSCKAHCFK